MKHIKNTLTSNIPTQPLRGIRGIFPAMEKKSNGGLPPATGNLLVTLRNYLVSYHLTKQLVTKIGYGIRQLQIAKSISNIYLVIHTKYQVTNEVTS